MCGDETDKLCVEAGHRLRMLVELPPNLLVGDPLLVTNLFEGPAQPHAEGAWCILQAPHGF
eukprot:6025583-Prorocentrum_lima.AAC.1